MNMQLSDELPKRVGQSLVLVAALGLTWGAALAETENPTLEPRPSEMMPLAPESLLLDIDRAGDNLVVVGERGHALIATDNKTFAQQQTPVRATLTAVDFVDAKNGWAVGHDAVIIASKDGGKSWVVQNWDPELEKPFLDVMFLDAQRGFALGAYGLMMRTRDGGSSWEAVENDITLDEWHFTAMTRLNDGALLIVGEAGGLALSRDEGDSWVQLESPYEGSYFGVLPWGDEGALIFGLRGNIFATQSLPTLDAVEEVAEGETGGEMAMPSAQWVRLNSGTVQSFMGGTLLPDGTAALVGVNGTIAQVDPSGDVTRVKNQVTLSFSSVIPTGGGTILVTGEGGTYPYNY